MAEATQSSEVKQSRLGKRPVLVPKGVNVTVKDGAIDVQGPKGKLKQPLPPSVEVTKDGDNLVVTCPAAGKDAPRLQGLGRALVANMVKGAAEGFTLTLELHGTGYRSEVKGKVLNLSLGLSHPVNLPIPEGITVTIPGDSKGTVIHIDGADKAAVGQFAAVIKRKRPPEPYGGKGIRFRGEQIRRKAGKAGKGRK